MIRKCKFNLPIKRDKEVRGFEKPLIPSSEDDEPYISID